MSDFDMPFTPVPARRARHDGWTPERQRAFLAGLARLGLVSAAASAVGMSARGAYRLRGRPGAESFAAAWDAALDEGQTRAACTVLDRAMNGVVVPIFYRGRQVGEHRKFDNRLALAALRTLRPRYGSHD